MAGSFIAFLANSKDEGIVLTVLMLIFLYGFFKKQDLRHQKAFLSVFLSLMGMFVLTEIFMRVSFGIPFVEGKYYGLDAGLVLDALRWKVFLLFWWQKMFLYYPTGGIIFLLLLCAIAKADKHACQGNFSGIGNSFLKVIGMFFFIFSMLYIMVTTDLDWRLKVTANRLFFIFYPTLVYFIFGFLYANEEW